MISYRTLSHYLCASVALVLCVLLAPASLQAGTIDASQLPTIKMRVEGVSNEWDYSPPVSAYVASTDNSGGYKLSSVQHAYGVCDGRANVQVDKLEFNPDPFVLNNILVTNTTATTQIYSVTVGLPTSFGAPNLISGNITTSVIEGGGNTATVSTVPGQPIYKAQIDLSTVATLQNDPFSLTTSSSTSASAFFGPTVSAIPVVSNIGIALTFQLTAGDSASILSRFDVNAIPEPGTLALCSGALFFGAGVFRRRVGRRA